ncbi:unnamed protein product [Chondrus crispus]|uniref:Uncharacterized protein n=1 Tax=Chondrus crispus TaxID=2769 RepID=R7QPE3_CHOCR|nr:unnamed protein product [Chondrus crispus]CDF39356.1 unnamed protein product [Chondrus crispus]|eukprot:XP_005719267.1 unnamed protein product [Chondrus crispus]
MRCQPLFENVLEVPGIHLMPPFLSPPPPAPSFILPILRLGRILKRRVLCLPRPAGKILRAD